VAHTYNPSYSGGRDQEDRGLKPAYANSLRDPISKKNLSQKRAGGVGVAHCIGPDFKPQYHENQPYKQTNKQKLLTINARIYLLAFYSIGQCA
jgi:hypothetical protein